MGLLSHFGKAFNDGSLFGFIPGNIRNVGLIWMLGDLTLKGQVLRCLGEEGEVPSKGKGG